MIKRVLEENFTNLKKPLLSRLHMIQVMAFPEWFSTASLVVDGLSAIVLAIIAFTCARYYRISKEFKWVWIVAGFGLLSIGFVSKFVFEFAMMMKGVGPAIGGVHAMQLHMSYARELILFLLIIASRLLFLLGLYALWKTHHGLNIKEAALTAYLLLIMLYFSSSTFYIFHLTALILSLLITTEYVKKRRANKHPTTTLLATFFGIFGLGEFLFILAGLNPVNLVIGQLVQFLGIVLLLLAYRRVTRHGKAQ